MNELISWSDELAKEAKELASKERPALSQISTRGGVLTYQNQQIPGNKLPCIVVASAFEHRYYDKRFDPNKREAPKCFALSTVGKDMVPHPDVKEKQAERCDACPHYQWGSDPNGGKGKACKAVRRLGLLPASAASNGTVKTVEVALINVPTMSAKNWANYVSTTAAQFGRPPWAVVTELSVVPSPRSQFEVKFQAMGIIEDEATLLDIKTRTKSIEEILLTPYDQSGNIADTYPGEEPKEEKKRKY
jgi:hypothetical protein